MSVTVTLNGVNYTIPEVGENNWGQNVTSYLTAIPSGVLQKTGGSFTLTGNVNFGANYGLLSKFFSTRTANPASAGLFRLAVADTIGWRNNANDADLTLGVNASDKLIFDGNQLVVTSSALLESTGVVFGDASGLLASDAGELCWDYNNNFLGVGVGPPLVKFHVRHLSNGELTRLESTGTGSNTIKFNQFSGYAAGAQQKFAFTTGATAATEKAAVLWDNDTNQLQLTSGGTLGLSIDTSGNVTAPFQVFSPIFATTTANVASTGKVRFANNEGLAWRNAANNANLTLLVNASDQLAYSGTIAAAFLGNITGNVTGNVTGDLTGDVTGNVTGDVTGNLTGNVTGNVSGTAATFTGNLTGDVTSVAMATTIANDAVTTAKILNNNVTNAKLAQMATLTIKGNSTGGAADPSDLSVTTVTAMLNAVVGDSGSGGIKGLVPAPAAGDAAAGKFLKADGTWTVVPSAGITDLTGDVTGTGPGSTATTVAEIQGETVAGTTGTNNVVFSDSPTLVTPTLGAATATSINKVAITAPAAAATLTILNNKTFTVNNTMTLTATDTASIAFGGGGTVAYTGDKLSVFAATTSAELATVISDETGSGGVLVFSSGPTLTGTTTAATLKLTGPFFMGNVSAISGAPGNGEIGMVNNNAIRWRNAAASAFLNAIYVDSSDNLQLGGGGATNDLVMAVSGVGTTLTLAKNTGVATFSSLAGVGSRAVNADAAGALSAASDSRLKSEVSAHLPGLKEILLLKPRAYQWLADIKRRGKDAAVEIGFFADEVAPIIPSAAPMGHDGYFGFYDRSVTAALVMAIQELKAQIDHLTTAKKAYT